MWQTTEYTASLPLWPTVRCVEGRAAVRRVTRGWFRLLTFAVRVEPFPRSMSAPSARKQPSPPRTTPDPRFDWRKIAYHTLVSRAMDDVEETTNRNRTSVPSDHLVLYQFSARGHDMSQ